MNRRALLALGLVAGALGVPSAVGANPRSPGEPPAAIEPVRLLADSNGAFTLGELITDPQRIHSEVLDGITADPELLGTRGAQLLDLRLQVEQAQLQREWAVSEQLLRTKTVAQSTTDQASEQSDLRTAQADQATKQSSLHAMSVDAFVNGSDEPDLSSLLTATNENSTSRANELLRIDELVEAAEVELVRQRDAAVAHRNQQQRELDAATARLTREQELLDVAASTQSEADATLADLEPRLGPAERRLERDLLLKTLPGTDTLQIVAVNAYFNASQIAHRRWPACRIAWHQLAGVGRVESFHGNFGASNVDSGGQISPPILGPQLNGDPWLAIPDTDEGLLDGDLEWDRAVGPMQFIPTSWAIFAGDGNGDGTADPHNLYDATVAAADHLCGSGLEDPDRFRRALLGYNRSVQYGHDVMDFAQRYQANADILDPWLETDLD